MPRHNFTVGDDLSTVFELKRVKRKGLSADDELNLLFARLEELIDRFAKLRGRGHSSDRVRRSRYIKHTSARKLRGERGSD